MLAIYLYYSSLSYLSYFLFLIFCLYLCFFYYLIYYSMLSMLYLRCHRISCISPHFNESVCSYFCQAWDHSLADCPKSFNVHWYHLWHHTPQALKLKSQFFIFTILHLVAKWLMLLTFLFVVGVYFLAQAAVFFIGLAETYHANLFVLISV